jgi:DNA-binding transcriptional LysR family regulator
MEYGIMSTVHLSRIDLNLFVVFDAIYAEGSITRAGQRLNLSQPAISHALGRLRAIFGDPLFSRHGHAMTPTPRARQMIEPVRESLERLEASLEMADRFEARTVRKRFTIGARGVVEPLIGPTLMRAIAGGAPRIDISIVRPDRREIERELSAGTLDLAVDVLLPLPDEIRRRRLSSERLVVLVRRDHPGVGRTLDLATYLALEHIQVSQRRRGLSPEDFELSRQDLRRRVRLRCQDYFAACRVAHDTDLAVTMSERYARIVNAQFGNRLLPFPIDAPVYDTYAYWHAGSDGDPANRWLREQVFHAFALAPAPKRKRPAKKAARA